MTNLTETDARHSTRVNLDQLHTEITCGLALLAIAPELECIERAEIGEKLMLARELVADARALLDAAAVPA